MKIEPRTWTTLFLAVLLAAACADQELPTTLPPDAVLQPADQMETLARESYSGVPDRRREVLRSRDALAAFWDELYANRQPVPPVPDVDFGESMVIAAALGERVSGGYGIEVEGIYRTADGLYVVVRETSPGSDCVVTTALTAPAVLVRVPRFDGPVAFVEHASEHDC
ncbi:MAG TPA: protease complex subunit PrcB family protein [Longimicrobiales bacterium]